MAVTDQKLTAIQSRRSILKSRFSRQHQIMRELESWRHLIQEDLIGEIWGNEPPSAAARWTIIKPDIASVTEAVVAILAGRDPHITALPNDPAQLGNQEAADRNERVTGAIFDTLDRNRSLSLLAESTEYAVHRGAIIGAFTWLSPKERGEERSTPDRLLQSVFGSANQPAITKPGDFPVLPRLLDPLDCTYVLGKDDKVIEFIHEYQANWDYLCDLFPDIADKDEFKTYMDQEENGGSSSDVTVVDWWNQTDNAILINDTFYKKPTPHKYHCLPFVVELVKPRNVRNGSSGAFRREGTPFCYYMLNSVRQMSMADSLSRRNIEKQAFTTMVLEGIDPENSPYMPVDKETGEPTFTAVFDLSGTEDNIIPAYLNEKWGYPRSPDLVPQMQEFKANRARDAAMVSFAEGMLSGQQMADLSGYAYNQMKQISLAKVEPPRMSLDRFWSRSLTLTNELIVDNWDLPDGEQLPLSSYGDRGRATPMMVDLKDFENVRAIQVEIKPEVPINQEQEWGIIIQMSTMGLISKMTAMEQIGIVQDPSMEQLRIAAEMFAATNEAARAALAQEYFKRSGIDINAMQPVQAAQPPGMGGPPPPDMGAGGMAGANVPPTNGAPQPMMPAPMPAQGPPPGMPMGPPMGGPPPGPAGPPPNIPPEILARLMQQQGA